MITSALAFIAMLTYATPSTNSYEPVSPIKISQISNYTQETLLEGQVTDKNGNAVPFAGITISKDKKVVRQILSDFNGYYTIRDLEAGEYSIEVSYAEYKKEKALKVMVISEKIVTANLKLKEISSPTCWNAYKNDHSFEKRDLRGRDYPELHLASEEIDHSVDRLAKVHSKISDGPITAISDQSAGQMTAKEARDLEKWVDWLTLLEDSDRQTAETTWKFYLNKDNRFPLQITDKHGNPIVDGQVSLHNSDELTFWSSRTDNKGNTELWKNIFGDFGEEFNLSVNYQGEDYSFKTSEVKKGKIQLPITRKAAANSVDIMFAVDATGSMGDEMEYLKAELNDIIKRAKAKNAKQKLDVRLGSVFYRDHGDSYITRKSDFTTNINQTLNFINNQKAGGGGDFPEAVDDALYTAIHDFDWSESATSRILFLMLDAPPHSDPEIAARIRTLSTQAAQKGIRIVPVVASGIDKNTEFLMRFLALSTNGTYVYITDDSGIGNAHTEATNSDSKVEYLNDLLVRLIAEFTSNDMIN